MLLSRPLQWLLLLALSLLLIAGIMLCKLPAAVLLGAMVAAIVIAVKGTTLQVPGIAFAIAQGIIGCMIARAMPLTIFVAMGHHAVLFLVMVLSVVTVSVALGWLLAHLRVLPGTTAIWGAFPGGATAMMLMAEAYGADIRLVAFMQYLRVVMVVMVASLVSRLWISAPHGAAAGTDWLAPVAWGSFAETLALIAVSITVARFIRMPAGGLLLPMALGIALHGTGLMHIELPPLLLAASYLLVGWSIGLRFTPAILKHAARALPQVLAALAALIAACGVFAALLSQFAGIDPLTAYLATSPGGADSVAIIAASSPKVDMPFVMALQTARFLFILFFGPRIARRVADAAGKRLKSPDAG